MIDAVQASRFIPEEKTNEQIDKLLTLTSDDNAGKGVPPPIVATLRKRPLEHKGVAVQITDIDHLISSYWAPLSLSIRANSFA